MFDESIPRECRDTPTLAELAAELESLPAVASADYLPAPIAPSGRDEIDLIVPPAFLPEPRRVPKRVAETIYDDTGAGITKAESFGNPPHLRVLVR